MERGQRKRQGTPPQPTTGDQWADRPFENAAPVQLRHNALALPLWAAGAQQPTAEHHGAHTIQRKLKVGASNDHYEQEAEHVAEQVMAMAPTEAPQASGALGQHITPLAQQPALGEGTLHTKRSGDADSFDASADFEQRVSAARGGGSPLPADVRAFMEPRFGADFSGVRLHTGGEAAQLNRQVSAQAFTHGSDIYMGEGRSNVGSQEGQQLLAHELTHVVQQGGAAALPDAPAPQASAAGPQIQRMSIKGEEIYPTGKNGKALLQKLKLAMFTAGLSPHGMGKIFKQAVQEDKNWASEEAFINNFVQHGTQEMQRVELARSQGQKKVKGWTRRLKMGRPGWPEAYKKVVKKGEDIRHIVRNATLKNAIEAERLHQAKTSEQQAAHVMKSIAQAMGLNVNCGHSVEWTMAIYRAAYLNLSNLFPGAGAINRVIGLTADHISKKGLDLMTSQDFADPAMIEETFEDVALRVSEVSDQMDRVAENMDPKTAEVFLSGFEEFSDNLEDYLIDREDELVKAAQMPSKDDIDQMDGELDVGVTKQQIGQELIDIGANFGFDIPDSALENEQMKNLIGTEIALNNYTPGQPVLLAQTLKAFMQIKQIMKI